VDTANQTVEQSVQQILDYIRANFTLDRRGRTPGIAQPEFQI